jgi:hypothetical protein
MSQLSEYLKGLAAFVGYRAPSTVELAEFGAAPGEQNGQYRQGVGAPVATGNAGGAVPLQFLNELPADLLADIADCNTTWPEGEKFVIPTLVYYKGALDLYPEFYAANPLARERVIANSGAPGTETGNGAMRQNRAMSYPNIQVGNWGDEGETVPGVWAATQTDLNVVIADIGGQLARARTNRNSNQPFTPDEE